MGARVKDKQFDNKEHGAKKGNSENSGSDATVEQIGASAILTIASQWEAKHRREVERLDALLIDTKREQLNPPQSKDGFDYATLIHNIATQRDGALESWTKAANMVHKFDKSVDVTKRDATESITRAEGQRIFSLATIYIRTACERFKESIVPQIRESKTNEEGFTIVEQAFSGAFENAMRGAVSESHVPNWLRDAIEENL